MTCSDKVPTKKLIPAKGHFAATAASLLAPFRDPLQLSPLTCKTFDVSRLDFVDDASTSASGPFCDGEGNSKSKGSGWSFVAFLSWNMDRLHCCKRPRWRSFCDVVITHRSTLTKSPAKVLLQALLTIGKPKQTIWSTKILYNKPHH